MAMATMMVPKKPPNAAVNRNIIRRSDPFRSLGFWYPKSRQDCKRVCTPLAARLINTLFPRPGMVGKVTQNLGNLFQAYQEVARRLGILHEQTNVRPLRYPKPKAVKNK